MKLVKAASRVSESTDLFNLSDRGPSEDARVKASKLEFKAVDEM